MTPKASFMVSIPKINFFLVLTNKIHFPRTFANSIKSFLHARNLQLPNKILNKFTYTI
jgi:hypothetical protein